MALEPDNIQSCVPETWTTSIKDLQTKQLIKVSLNFGQHKTEPADSQEAGRHTGRSTSTFTCEVESKKLLLFEFYAVDDKTVLAVLCAFWKTATINVMTACTPVNPNTIAPKSSMQHEITTSRTQENSEPLH